MSEKPMGTRIAELEAEVRDVAEDLEGFADLPKLVLSVIERLDTLTVEVHRMLDPDCGCLPCGMARHPEMSAACGRCGRRFPIAPGQRFPLPHACAARARPPMMAQETPAAEARSRETAARLAHLGDDTIAPILEAAQRLALRGHGDA